MPLAQWSLYDIYELIQAEIPMREACVARVASFPHFFTGAVKKPRPTTVAGRELLAAGREVKNHVDIDAFVAFFRSAAASFPSSTQSAIGVPDDLVLSVPPKPLLECPKDSRHRSWASGTASRV